MDDIGNLKNIIKNQSISKTNLINGNNSINFNDGTDQNFLIGVKIFIFFIYNNYNNLLILNI